MNRALADKIKDLASLATFHAEASADVEADERTRLLHTRQSLAFSGAAQAEFMADEASRSADHAEFRTLDAATTPKDEVKA